VVKGGAIYTGRKNFVAGALSNANFSFSTDFSLEASYTWIKYNFTMSGFYKFTGRMPQFYATSAGKLEEGYISAFHTLDISLIKNLFKNRVSMSLGAKNLFDVKSIMAVGSSTAAHSGGGSGTIPMGWGRTYFLKLSFHLYHYNHSNGAKE
jgi:outer membrane receptor for ferrienterochelin and colicins